MSSFFAAFADSKILSEIQELLFGVFNGLVVDWFFDDLCVFKIYDGILLPFPTDNFYSEYDMSFLSTFAPVLNPSSLKQKVQCLKRRLVGKPESFLVYGQMKLIFLTPHRKQLSLNISVKR